MNVSLHGSALNRRLIIFAIAAGCLFTIIVLGPTLDIYKAQADPTQQHIEALQTTVAALLNPRRTLTSRAFVFQTETRVSNLDETRAVIETNSAATNAYFASVTVQALTATFTPSSTPTPALDATQLFSTLMADVAQRFTATSRAPLTQTATAGYAYTVNSIILQTLGVTATSTPSATFTPSMTLTPSATALPSATLTPSGSPTAIPKQLIIESDNAQVRRSGQWQVFESDFASGGSFMVSGETGGASLTVSFRGTAVDVVYVKAQQLGLFAIEVDGKWVRTIDSNATKSEFDARAKVRGLKFDNHRLRAYSLRGAFAIDAFVIEPQAPSS